MSNADKLFYELGYEIDIGENMEEDIKVLKDFINVYKKTQEMYKDDEIQAEIERNCYFEEVPAKEIETILNELERLQKEFEALKEQDLSEEYDKSIKYYYEELEEKNKVLKENENLREHNRNLYACCRVSIEQNKKDKEFLLDKLEELENALNSEKTVHTCLHCGNDTPLYCEKCQQELISKNAELQLENEKLKKKHKMICELNVELLENIENFIPKQVLRNRIADLEEVKSKYNFLIGTSYRADGAINTLKEILGDE